MPIGIRHLQLVTGEKRMKNFARMINVNMLQLNNPLFIKTLRYKKKSRLLKAFIIPIKIGPDWPRRLSSNIKSRRSESHSILKLTQVRGIGKIQFRFVLS